MPININIDTYFIRLLDAPNSYAGAGGFVVSVNTGEDGLEFRQIIEGNIMKNNLEAEGDRSQDMNGFSMSFIDGKQFKWTNTVAPTIGEGSFDFTGYGTTSTQIVWRLKNGVGVEKIKLLGNGGVSITDQLALNGTTESGALLFMRQKNSVGGFAIICQDPDGGNQFTVQGGQVDLCYRNLRFQKSGSLNLVDTLTGTTRFRVNTDVSTINVMEFKANGVIQLMSTPIGNAGRASGEIYLGTAAEAAANGDLILIQKT